MTIKLKILSKKVSQLTFGRSKHIANYINHTADIVVILQTLTIIIIIIIINTVITNYNHVIKFLEQ